MTLPASTACRPPICGQRHGRLAAPPRRGTPGLMHGRALARARIRVLTCHPTPARSSMRDHGTYRAVTTMAFDPCFGPGARPILAETGVAVHVPGWIAAVAAVVSIASAVGCTHSQRPRASVKPSSSPSTAPTSSAARTQRDALRHYVETDPTWIRGALSGGSYGGRFFCGLNVLGDIENPPRVYIWATCEEFYDNDGTATLGSAASLPAALRVAGAGSTTRVIGFAVPRSGSLYGPDVRRLFPHRLVATIFAGGHAVDQTDAQLRARAGAALRAGLLPSASSG
jgi:hypothetical protein